MPASATSHSDEDRRLLVVEDEVLIRMSIADELQRAGYTTLEAADRDEAVAILKSSEIALVLTNVRMDGSLDGIDLAKWIAANRRGLSVIFISANVTGDIERELGGGQHVLTKPIDYAAMLRLVGDLLRQA